MEDRQALNILMALANGVHPFSDQKLPSESPYQLPEVVRALFTAARLLEQRLLKTEDDNKVATQKVSTHSDTTAKEKSSAEVLADKNLPTGNAKNSNRSNVGKPWTAEEDRQLLVAFDSETPLPQIAKAHGRTQNGVRARLEKHGRLPPSDAPVDNPNAIKRWPRNNKNGSEVRDGDGTS